ncbi:MAG: rhamnulokinase, partial [Eggerthellaceae bacterium]|nr:rhamnulokinase [Eggerthellaceae bacterium]
YYLAIDIGASSGRHVLGHVQDGKIVLEEVHRFDNIQQRKRGHDCWDIDMLWKNVLAGIEQCGAIGKVPVSLGIDTWGVDFVLLDAMGKRVGDAVAYRDDRTTSVACVVDEKIGLDKLYEKTGIQRQEFNTVYQFAALAQEHPEELAAAERFLMIPEYLNYLLTGRRVNEYTNATTTNMLNARTLEWDSDVLDALGIPSKIFGPVSMPGSNLGGFTDAVRPLVGFDCEVILPATHDTGSAFLAVPAQDENAVYLSSGTWSLLGVENRDPITTEESRLHNFTNEGGYQKRFRYLKNIMGLWMIQSIRRELNGIDYVAGKGAGRTRSERTIGFGELANLAREEEKRVGGAAAPIVNVNDERFLSPQSMIEEIKRACRDTGQEAPETTGALMRCVYKSLTRCYAETIVELSEITGRTYTSLNVVGGGCQDAYLNELTAHTCGIPVYAGPVEGTSLGNLMVQMIQGGEFSDLQEARCAIRKSFDVKTYLPE